MTPDTAATLTMIGVCVVGVIVIECLLAYLKYRQECREHEE